MKVNEIFESFQFEGSRSGTLNVYIRFSGCNRQCSFCDTQHQKYVEMSPQQIVDEVLKKYKAQNVILTGGEPLLQPEYDMVNLIETLKSYNIFIAMESNGDLVDSGKNFNIVQKIDHLTISPKLPKSPDIEIAKRMATEIKIILPDNYNLIDFTKAEKTFIQPEWNNPESLKYCMNFIKEHSNFPFRLSIQTHKYLGIE